MSNSRKLKRFILFCAPSMTSRKDFVASFDSRIEAISEGESLKTNPAMRWQVIDNQISEVVAEDPGL
jgi:hypothetical protein